MNSILKIAGLLGALLAIPSSVAADAPTVEELNAQGRVTIDASLEPNEGIVAGQKLALVIELATDRWFTGGTRLTLPEVPGLVILQTEQFASNASETRGAQSWVIQRWTLDVYPQKSGDFTIPPIRANIRINGGDTGNIEGELLSPAAQFSASLPPGMDADQSWVAAPSFSATQSFDRELQGLKVGDAFERTLHFQAGDVMAMMLPSFTPETQPGLGIYPSPPELENSSNRGEVNALRRQTISYVVEREGNYRLPATEFFWWDTSSRELRIVRLEETVFTIGSSTGTAETTVDPARRQLLLAIAAGILVIAAIALLMWRYFPRSLPARLTDFLSRALTLWRRWRRPALPDELNPGNNAGARRA